MFNGKKNMAKSNEIDGQSRNHIASGTKIYGDVETNGDIRVDGVLVGSITSTGKVVIGETGKIEGEIRCENSNISGVVKGKVLVKDLLSLQATAHINGDIETSKLSIEPGASFTGNCNMGAVIKDISENTNEKRTEKTA
jgi:cytoskeletal protein CcmA (bactofilin family)